jgi:hypothetical protein
MAIKVKFLEVTCSGVPGIHILCNGTEDLRRLDQLMAALQGGTVRQIDLLAELLADAEGVESCLMELVLAERALEGGVPLRIAWEPPPASVPRTPEGTSG